MRNLSNLIEQNRAWAEEMLGRDPGFFERLAEQQAPEALWIGCSDSRVPANQIVGMLPGEMFVHRNVANIVDQTDFNFLSVLQYAVDVLKVEHVIVCGHYGCGGVLAALRGDRLGLIDNWLRNIRRIYELHQERIDDLPGEETRHDRLCELNVIQQVAHVCETTIVQGAWLRGQSVTVHGWIYGLKDGHLKDLDTTICAAEETRETYRRAMARVFE